MSIVVTILDSAEYFHIGKVSSDSAGLEYPDKSHTQN